MILCLHTADTLTAGVPLVLHAQPPAVRSAHISCWCSLKAPLLYLWSLCCFEQRNVGMWLRDDNRAAADLGPAHHLPFNSKFTDAESSVKK